MTSIKQRARAGRPRQSGPRTATGRRIVEAKGQATWQRIREHGEALGADPRLAGEIGRLSYAKVLTDTQATTAIHIASWYYRGAKVLCSPRRSPVTSSLMSQGPDERLTEQDLEQIAAGADVVDEAELEQRDRSAVRRLQKLQRMLPPQALDLVERACVLDQPVSDEHLGAFATLLSHVAQAFGIEHKTPLPALPPALKPRKRAAPQQDRPARAAKPKERLIPLSMVIRMCAALRPDASDRIRDLVEATYARERFRREKQRQAGAQPCLGAK